MEYSCAEYEHNGNVEYVGPQEYRMHRGWEVFAFTITFVWLCRMPRIMFVWLRISSKYKFQLNWILTKQSCFTDPEAPCHTWHSSLVCIEYPIHVCISMINRLLYKPPHPRSFHLFCIQTRFHSNFKLDTNREMLVVPTPSFRYAVSWHESTWAYVTSC